MSAYVLVDQEESGADLLLPLEELAGMTASQVLAQEGCPYEAEINLLVTGEEEIRETNREFRGIDKVTDVLSFPALDFASPADFSGIDEEISFNLDTGRLYLGDIMICAQKVLSQAEEYGHTPRREFCFLVAHSCLHLLGYDHMDPEEDRVMREHQNMALDALGISR